MKLPVAILAGGLATRLYPVTHKTPKSLLNVAGKPFIDWQLDHLQAQGTQHVVLCLGYLGEHIQNHLKANHHHPLHLSYSFDGESPLGTGGALKQALPLLGDAFFVLYGDSYLPISFQTVEDLFLEHTPPALMTIFKNEQHWDTSNVYFENGRLLEYNKYSPKPNMHYIDFGLSIISSSMFDKYPIHKPFDLADFYHQASLDGLLMGHEVSSRFYEIGSREGWEETSRFLSKDLNTHELYNTTPS